MKGLKKFEYIHDISYTKNKNDKSFCWSREINKVTKKFEHFIELQKDHYGEQYFLNFDKIIESYIEQGYSDTVLAELKSGSIHTFEYVN